MKLILGSSSPRRKEILGFFSFPFDQKSPDFDEESVLFQNDPAQYAIDVAVGKARALQRQFPNSPILSADTVVYRNGKLFQKPKSLKEAEEMLLELSKGEQEVYTGVAVLYQDKLWTDVEMSTVEFCDVTLPQIQAYVKTLRPLDKSGSYTVQGLGGLIVKRVSGCYYNIVGLPIQTVRRCLLHVGIDLWDSFKQA